MKSEQDFDVILQSGFSAFKVDFEKLGDALVHWQNPILTKYGASVTMSKLNGCREDLITSLLPLVSPIRTKHLLIDIDRKWTIALDNGHLGTDASIAPVLSEKCQCDSIRVVSQPDTYSRSKSKGRFGAEIFEYFSHGELCRSIFCSNDGGKWRFGQSGCPLPIEKSESYLQKNVKERFTGSDLRRILDFFNINIFDEFEGGGHRNYNAILYTRSGQFPNNYMEIP